MTFQVAAVAMDGAIIGSDRRQIYYQKTATANTQSSNVKKIVKGDFVVCAYAGSEPALLMANAISKLNPSGLERLDWFSHVKKTANEGASEHAFGSRGQDEVIVARTDQPSNLLMVSKQGTNEATCLEITERICAGSYAPARFIMHHLWRDGATTDDLRPLVLLALAFASKEHPGVVGGGFDLAILRNGTEPVEDTYSETDERLIHALSIFESNMNSGLSAARSCLG